MAFENDLGMRFVLIPAGTFLMGSPEDEYGHFDKFETRHEVTITRPYYFQITEVTTAQYRHKEAWPRGFSREGIDGANQPVVLVSWGGARAFASWLSIRPGARSYDLPTEAQWERACRAGTSTPFSFGERISANQANYDGTRYDGTQLDEEDYRGVEVYSAGRGGVRRGHALEVGTLSRNRWGLYDMHVNVSEWCLDWVGKFPSEAVKDPCQQTPWYERIHRGGSWARGPESCRSAARSWCNPLNRTGVIGFRLVSPLPEPGSASAE